MKRALLLVAFALTTFSIRTAEAGPLKLKSVGGATLAGVTTLEISGTPGDSYLVVLSLSGGPTALPLPHQPNSIDVGFDLLDLSLSIPGFLGTIPAGGTVVLPLPIPGDPILAFLTLHFQALRIVNNVKFDGKSNPWKWTPAAPGTTRLALDTMTVARAGYAVVTQPDVTVLFFGGGNDGLAASYGQTSVDRYDPGTQTFTPVADMLFPRSSHTATPLGNGKILLVGGADDILGEPTNKAELYDPATNSSLALPNLTSPRALHTANLLPDGRVLVAGGTTSFNSPQDIVTNSLRSTEIFNPVTNTWSAGPNMAEPRVGHTATALTDNRILFAGGFSWVQIIVIIPFVSDKAQLYTPNAGLGTFGANTTMATGDRFAHTAIRLDNGRVWLIGGAQDQASSPFDPVAVNTIAEYDPVSNSFAIGATMTTPRGVAAVTRLGNGHIVIAGGAYGALSVPTPDSTIDVLDQSGVLFGLLNMQHVRANFFATTLCDGTVLLAGGGEYNDPLVPSIVWSWEDAEILHP